MNAFGALLQLLQCKIVWGLRPPIDLMAGQTRGSFFFWIGKRQDCMQPAELAVWNVPMTTAAVGLQAVGSRQWPGHQKLCWAGINCRDDHDAEYEKRRPLGNCGAPCAQRAHRPARWGGVGTRSLRSWSSPALATHCLWTLAMPASIVVS